MKKLDTKFNRHGNTYVQLKRTARVAMYEVRSEFGGLLGLEVIKIKVAPACFIKLTKSQVPERETYPSDEEFGIRGWYWPVEAREKAMLKYLELTH